MPTYKRKIYVASSWRNFYQPDVVKLLRALGHDVYDFRNPPGRAGFSWSQIDQHWGQWSNDQFRKSLLHPAAVAGYDADFSAMWEADTCVLVMPAGRSACIEAGWFGGAGRDVVVYLPERIEPELMFRMFQGLILISPAELTDFFTIK